MARWAAAMPGRSHMRSTAKRGRAARACALAALAAAAVQLRPDDRSLLAFCATRAGGLDASGAARSSWSHTRQPARIARRVTREEMLAQSAGRVQELTPITQDDLNINFFIFLSFSIPFLYAAYEFWRRIAFGQQFGTGDDNVVFERFEDAEARKAEEAKAAALAASSATAEAVGEAPASDARAEADGKRKKRPIGKKDQMTIGMDADTNRNRRTLGLDALLFAYFLMFLAAGTVAVSGVAVMPLLTGQVAVAQ
eukprot:TRINITY_DN20080_c0_g1_i1.p1 TRINITY_DN20080_c0_g1~~TRINITY_DN20080_c0_g1_i1.p1  ORF type:complete len:277 (-),score=58.48 TRINITY_DN20080_c0_g1_i1:304-1065(-)